MGRDQEWDQGTSSEWVVDLQSRGGYRGARGAETVGDKPVAGKTLLECSFLIPIRRDRNQSDGRLHSERAWKWLNERLYEFGGATRGNELYEGWYVDPDTRKPVTDFSRKFVVAIARGQLQMYPNTPSDLTGTRENQEERTVIASILSPNGAG